MFPARKRTLSFLINSSYFYDIQVQIVINVLMDILAIHIMAASACVSTLDHSNEYIRTYIITYFNRTSNQVYQIILIQYITLDYSGHSNSVH